MSTHALRRLAALIALVLLVAACGDGEGGDAAEIPKEQAIAQVTERCVEVNRTFEDLNFEEEPERVAEELEGFVEDVRQMPPPDEDREVLERMLAALETSAQRFREAAEAPEEEREEALGAAFASFGPAEEASMEFGMGALQDCGREVEEANPDAERVEVTAREYEFDLADTVPAGPVTFVLHNDGEEPHHMVVVRFTGDETVEDVLAAEQAGQNPDELVEDVGDSATASPGGEVVLNADLSEGRYAMLCFISAPDGEPHAFKGMHTEFTVGA